MKSTVMAMLQSLVFILVAVWLLLSLLLYLFQPRFIYYPLPETGADPGDAGLEHEEVTLFAADGVQIYGWYLPHPSPRATLLFLHGNGGNLSHRLDKLDIFHQLGLATLIIDYRGYGRSEGEPSEDGTYLDAEAAWQYLTGEKGVQEKRIIVYGESLGGAIGAWLASRHKAGALVVESGFTSIVAMGRHYYPYLPVGLLARIKYPALEYMKRVNCPLLVIHSPADEIVPYGHGRALYEAARGPKSFLEISGDHNSGFYTSGERYREGWDRFISHWFQKPMPGS